MRSWGRATADDSGGVPKEDMASVLKTAAAEWKSHAAARLVFHGEIRMLIGSGSDGYVVLKLGDYLPALKSNGGPAPKQTSAVMTVTGAGTSTTHRTEKAAPAASSSAPTTAPKPSAAGTSSLAMARCVRVRVHKRVRERAHSNDVVCA